jgi:hypothetical protein
MANQRISSPVTVARARPGTPTITVALTGVAAGATAGVVTYLKTPSSPGVASGASAGAMAIEIDVAAPAVTSGAVAGWVGFTDGAGSAGLTPEGSRAVANDVALQIDSTVTLTGVSAAGAAGAVGPEIIAPLAGVAAGAFPGDVVGFVAPIGYLPTQRLMRNVPVPSDGPMGDEPVASRGTLFPNGVEPVNIAQPVFGVSAQCVAVTVSFTRNVKVPILGASSAAKAAAVTPT